MVLLAELVITYLSASFEWPNVWAIIVATGLKLK